jgi:hypothetical protein
LMASVVGARVGESVQRLGRRGRQVGDEEKGSEKGSDNGAR